MRELKRIFQLTTSQGGRRTHRQKLTNWKNFQLTTSQGGRQELIRGELHSPVLSTHDLTRRSTNYFLLSSSHIKLSTHDLTRRSTGFKFRDGDDLWLSTHDLTRRSTACSPSTHASSNTFNSRPHKEVDKDS